MDRSIAFIAGAGVLALAGGCVATVRPARMAVVAPGVSVAYVDREPPPPRYEPVPEAPGGDYVWLEGFWRWDARSYVWVPGRYILRPHPRALWIPGHWRRHERGWYWTEGYWR